jgi:hypothetical protein
VDRVLRHDARRGLRAEAVEGFERFLFILRAAFSIPSSFYEFAWELRIYRSEWKEYKDKRQQRTFTSFLSWKFAPNMDT